MTLRFLLLIQLIAAVSANAQITFVTDDYFPADLEFGELRNVTNEKNTSDPLQLQDIQNSQLISDVGFKSYSQREYAVGEQGFLSVEIVTLIDYRAAYSLLSLLRKSPMQQDLLGDASSIDSGEILFCHGRRWVRILGRNVSDDLLRRVATSISNRMGPPVKKLPSLISYLPESGLQAESLQYFPSKGTFETFHSSARSWGDLTNYEMEIAEALYDPGNHSGQLSLLKFPTSEMAEAFFSYVSSSFAPANDKEVFIKLNGPLLSILEGSFSSHAARAFLDTIRYGYSVQWIRDKQAQYTVVWGIPVHILNTTVWSFFLVLTLCVFSIFVGGFVAGVRLLIRYFFPQNPFDDPERTEITRLKLP